MQRQFFATADDLLPVFERVEAKWRLSYTLAGLFVSDQLTTVSSGAAIATLRDPAPHPSAIACPQYLVTAAGSKVAIQAVPQKAGGIRYAVDQLANPDSIVIQPGGVYAPNVLLHGRVGSASPSPFSKDVYRAFVSAIDGAFRRVRSTYVGPGAQALWESGHRLTHAVKAPAEYDLAL